MTSSARDPRLVAALDLIGRSGATSSQIRYSDDEHPVVWIAVASYKTDDAGRPHASGWNEQHEAAAALTPADAAVRLCERIVDGGECRHCRRPAGVATDWQNAQPLGELICWYVYDPETQRFRRSCEAEVPRQSRNDPCFCGSGRKFKKCHGEASAA